MEITCDKCQEQILSPEIKTIRDGDIEYTYFTCPACGEAYPVSVTDGKLRKDIGEYRLFAARIKKNRGTEAFQRKVQKLKEANIQRSRELKGQYPLAPVLMHGK